MPMNFFVVSQQGRELVLSLLPTEGGAAFVMEPWLADNISESVREKCKELAANAEEEAVITIGEISDDEWRAIAVALKRNTSLERLDISDDDYDEHPLQRSLSITAATSLAAAIASHHTVRILRFCHIGFTEFNAISLAISQNSNLQKLEMEECLLSPSIEESIAYLLKENALESLKLIDSIDQELLGSNYVLGIANAFRHNRSLKEFTLKSDFGGAISLRTLEDLALMLRENKSVESLYLDLCNVQESYDAVSDILRESEGQQYLKVLAIPCFEEEADERIVALVANLLTVPSSLEELDLSYWSINSEDSFRVLASGLRHKHCSLKKISLDGTESGDSCIHVPVVDALRENSSMEEVCLYCCNLHDEGARHIANLLNENQSIRSLKLGFNRIKPEGAVAIANALRTNTSLEELDLELNPIGEKGACALIEALEDHNTSLHRLSFFVSESFKAKAERLTALNRAGRKILNVHDLPRSLWPHILAKSSDKPDVIYYFLQQKPELFMKEPSPSPRHLGKRKRDIDDSSS